MAAEIVDLAAYRERRERERAWDLAWVNLELLELDAKAVHVRSRMALAETEAERDQHAQMLSRLGALRAGYLAEKRALEAKAGGRRG